LPIEKGEKREKLVNRKKIEIEHTVQRSEQKYKMKEKGILS
jgi:hypothetical protein